MLIKHYFHVSLFIMLVLAFESVEEIHLNVTIQMRATTQYFLLCGVVYYAAWGASNFEVCDRKLL